MSSCWSCPACTFDNHIDIPTCEMCGTQKSCISQQSTISSNPTAASGTKTAVPSTAGRVPTTDVVYQGVRVDIVLKADQSTGALTRGVVKTILTRGNHPRGIKVQLEDGQVGRVQNVLPSTKSDLSKPSSTQKPFSSVSSTNASTVFGGGGTTKPKLNAGADDFVPGNKKVPATHASSATPGNKTKASTQPVSALSSGPKRKCGCMATVHVFAGSCYQCGRTFCELEAPCESCYSCSAPYVHPMNADEASAHGLGEESVRAYAHKDKLLFFDKEHAKRTRVLDAQGDYYNASAWLTEEEKAEIAERERRRREKFLPSHRRHKTITLDFASRRVLQEDILDEDDDKEKSVCDSGSDAERMDGLGASFEGINIDGSFSAVGSDSWSKLDVKTRASKALSAAETDSPTFSRSASGGNSSEIENVRLGIERGLAGDIYRSLIRSLVPSRTTATMSSRRLLESPVSSTGF